jgi:hypothetical protein
MAVELQAPPQVTVTETVQGILTDMKTLLSQQVAMVRAELKADWQRTRAALFSSVLGAILLLVSGPVVCMALAFLLHYLTAPAGTDPAHLPLWACVAIVGGLVALVGGGLIWDGVRRFRSFTPLPVESLRALEENVQWLTNKK